MTPFPSRLAAAVLFAATALSSMAAAPAHAQQPAMPGIGGSDAPLEIDADNGLELYQDRQLVVAKGNVVARQGGVVLRADNLSASYEEASGERQVQRIDAVGNVRIATDQQRLFGDHVTYDLNRKLMIVTGRKMRIETEQETVTAEESLEFWQGEQRAVARGNATVTQDTVSLRADVIEALLASDPAEGGEQADNAVPSAFGAGQAGAVKRVRAWGNVTIRTPSEIVQGDEGDYDVSKGVAVLSGNVQISRGKNQLNGDQAIVDLKTGVSRLVGSSGGRVRTILFPDEAGGQNAPAGESQPQQSGEASSPSIRFILPRKRPGSDPMPVDAATLLNNDAVAQEELPPASAAPGTDAPTTPTPSEAAESGERPAQPSEPSQPSTAGGALLPPAPPQVRLQSAETPVPPARPAAEN